MITVAATSVQAQDLWSGGYIGIDAGIGGGPVSVTNSASGVDPGPFTYDVSGPVGGLTLGYLTQMGTFVLGIEGDVGYAAPQGQGYVASSDPAYHQDLIISAGMLAGISAKAGLSFDSTLIYAKGGLAYFGGQALQQTTKPGYAGTPSQAFTGASVGVGMEHFLIDGISLKAEYQHYMFGKVQGYQTATVADGITPAGTVFPNETSLGFDTVKVGINFHF